MNSPFLEVGIGLVFIFLTMSIIVSGINEIIAAKIRRRGKMLKNALHTAFAFDELENWVEKIYRHPLIDTLKETDTKLPSYISSSTFAKVLVDTISNDGEKEKPESESAKHEELSDDPIKRFEKGLRTLKDNDTKILFQSFYYNANNDFEKLKTNVENWYNEYMERVSGWYKKKTQFQLGVIGLCVAVLMNVDTVRLSTELWNSSVLREAVANAADGFAAGSQEMSGDSTFNGTVDNITSAYNKLQILNLPIGWGGTSEARNKLTVVLHEELKQNEEDNSKSSVSRYMQKTSIWWSYYIKLLCIFKDKIGLSMVLGWIFTALAVSYGAPFWFDLLNKLINLRYAGKSVTATKKETESGN